MKRLRALNELGKVGDSIKAREWSEDQKITSSFTRSRWQRPGFLRGRSARGRHTKVDEANVIKRSSSSVHVNGYLVSDHYQSIAERIEAPFPFEVPYIAPTVIGHTWKRKERKRVSLKISDMPEPDTKEIQATGTEPFLADYERTFWKRDDVRAQLKEAGLRED